MIGGGQEESHAIEARRMLEQGARAGYVPAMVSLTDCLFEGRCGPPALDRALTWAYVGKLLHDQGLIPRERDSPYIAAAFEGKYVALRWALSEKRVEGANRAARGLIGRMSRIFINPPPSWPHK
jgi:hypothetical protein